MQLVAAALLAGIVAAQDLTLVENDIGGVCLDGSWPGYYFSAGFGDGVDKWMILLGGGAWCYDEDDCAERSLTFRGSSNFATPTTSFGGAMSSDPADNPDLYNWNMVSFMYCDGASFGGDVEEPVNVNGTVIYFRGTRALTAMVNHLLDERGMRSATDLIYSGGSAGGMAAILTIEHVQSMIPPTIKLRGLPDCGLFIDVPVFNPDEPSIQDRFKYMFNMQQMWRGGLPARCLAAFPPDEQWKCVFPENLAPFVSTPIFFFNSFNDVWQLNNILFLGCWPWECPPDAYAAFEDFVDQFDEKFLPWAGNPNNGWFLNSCMVHGQLTDGRLWNFAEINGQTPSRTFINWYYDRPDSEGPQRLYDERYPSEISSCPIGKEVYPDVE